MAISFVGGTSATNSAGSISSISLTSLSGGSGSSPSAGDIVIITINNSRQDGGATYPVISGYTDLATLTSNDSNDVWSTTSYKVMTSTPDTSISFTVSNTYGVAVAVQVWRSIDQTTPIDVTTTTATGINGSVPDPASITPVTSGAVVLAVGHTSYDTATTREITAAPSGYSNFVEGHNTNAIDRASAAIASKAWTSGAENPGVFTNGGTNVRDSWTAVTIALRPGPTYTSELLKGAYTLTGKNLSTFQNYVGTLLKGAYALTGKQLNAAMQYSVQLLKGSYSITGKNLNVPNRWNNESKNAGSWTNQSKNAGSWTNQSKNAGNWTNQSKS